MRAGDVYVVGLCEAVPERDFGGEVVDVECCALRGDISSRIKSLGRGACVHTSVVDENVDMSRAGFDLLESLLD